MTAGLALIMHSTYACDAACDYCSVHKRGSEVKAMDERVFDQVAYRMEEFFSDKEIGSDVQLYWLGGEAILLPDSFYEYVDERLTNSPMSQKVLIRHQLQSNLLRFGKKDLNGIKNLLQRNKDKNVPWKYEVSTSFDPVSNVRKMKSGESYDKLFLQALHRIRKEKGKVGVIYTVHSGSIGKAAGIYNYFKNIGFVAFALNSVMDFKGEFSEKDLQMTPRDYGQFLIDMWKRWVEDDYKMGITPFESWKKIVDEDDESLLRCQNDGVCSGHMFSIGPQGSISHCNFADQASEKPMGDIYKESFTDLLEVSRENNRQRVEHIYNNQCKGCQWWRFCRGGCPYEAKGHYQGEYDKSHWCESYKMIFEYINQEKNS
jgi:radical SAM protein with 4Fe4S-binding SPASM domain